jgi:hypothetical protein
MEEKKNFLNKASAENFVLFLEHDSVNECCTLTHTEKGVRLGEQFSLNELFS